MRDCRRFSVGFPVAFCCVSCERLGIVAVDSLWETVLENIVGGKFLAF